MPFLNDVVEANKANNREQRSQKTAGLSRFFFDPENIVQHLKNNIIGQDEAIAKISDTLFRVKAEINEDHKPLGVLFLLGPTGVGKTEIVNLIARSITGNDSGLCRIDMNTLSQSHYAASLSGAPPGYAGSKENYTLFNTEAIAGTYSRPGVVLFDEIEKASKEVIRSLLNVLDNGKLTLTSGTKEINFCNSLIFFTSNLGSSSLLEKSLLKRKTQKSHQKAFKALEQFFDPEFLNRIEQFIYFHPLEDESLNKLIELEEVKLNNRIKRSEAIFKLSESTKKALKSAYQRRYGARNIHHRIKRDIEPLIARFIMNHSLDKQHYEISYKKNNFFIE